MKSWVFALSLLACNASAQERKMIDLIQSMKPEPPAALEIMDSPLAIPDGRVYAMRVTLARQEKVNTFVAQFAYPKSVVSRIELLVRNAQVAHATNRTERTEKLNNEAQEVLRKYKKTYYMIIVTTPKTDVLQPVRLGKELLVLGQYVANQNYELGKEKVARTIPVLEATHIGDAPPVKP